MPLPLPTLGSLSPAASSPVPWRMFIYKVHLRSSALRARRIQKEYADQSPWLKKKKKKHPKLRVEAWTKKKYQKQIHFQTEDVLPLSVSFHPWGPLWVGYTRATTKKIAFTHCLLGWKCECSVNLLPLRWGFPHYRERERNGAPFLISTFFMQTISL